MVRRAAGNIDGRRFARRMVVALFAVIASNLGTEAVAAQSAETVFAPVLPKLKAITQVPVYLPVRLPAENGNWFADILNATPTSYLVEFSLMPNCNGTSACSFGDVSGSALNDKDFPPLSGKKMRLADGEAAYFNAAICGGAGYTDSVLLFSRHGYRRWESRPVR